MQSGKADPALFSYLVEVPFRTSHMEHLKASGWFLKVQTEQSHVPSSSWDDDAVEGPAPPPPPPPEEPLALRFLLQRSKVILGLGGRGVLPVE